MEGGEEGERERERRGRRGSDRRDRRQTERSFRNTNELMLQHVDISFFLLSIPSLPPPPSSSSSSSSAGRRVPLLACHPVVTPEAGDVTGM